MKENKLIGQVLILDLFSIICGYYFIATLNAFVKQHDWQYDLLGILIVICEMVYNWIQILKYRNKIPRLHWILTSITLSAILTGTYISVILSNIQGRQNYINNLVLAILWGCMVIIGNIVLWRRYNKNN